MQCGGQKKRQRSLMCCFIALMASKARLCPAEARSSIWVSHLAAGTQGLVLSSAASQAQRQRMRPTQQQGWRAALQYDVCASQVSFSPVTTQRFLPDKILFMESLVILKE